MGVAVPALTVLFLVSGVHVSPHWSFHGAIDQITTLEHTDSIIPFDPDARRKVADTLVAMWQKSGSYFDADRV